MPKFHVVVRNTEKSYQGGNMKSLMGVALICPECRVTMMQERIPGTDRQVLLHPVRFYDANIDGFRPKMQCQYDGKMFEQPTIELPEVVIDVKLVR